ncbi:Hypothetical protein CINCED_3A002719 [Cinara cedri]|nr:Hypothetical protein CINCED_3A002719 [Cinara cedri]
MAETLKFCFLISTVLLLVQYADSIDTQPQKKPSFCNKLTKGVRNIHEAVKSGIQFVNTESEKELQKWNRIKKIDREQGINKPGILELVTPKIIQEGITDPLKAKATIIASQGFYYGGKFISKVTDGLEQYNGPNAKEKPLKSLPNFAKTPILVGTVAANVIKNDLKDFSNYVYKKDEKKEQDKTDPKENKDQKNPKEKKEQDKTDPKENKDQKNPKEKTQPKDSGTQKTKI